MKLTSVLNRLGRSRRDSRQSSSRSRRFTCPGEILMLESRQLMAAGPLGINLAGTLGFVDLMKETRAFTPLNSSTLPTDAQGWPEADAQIVVLDERVNQWFNGPDPNAAQPDIGGTYHLSFQGNATVTPDWLQNYTVQNQVYNAATNTTTADLVVQHNSYAMLYIDFRNTVNPSSATGAGVSSVKLIQPGYAADTTQIFTNTMLNDLAPFTALRYLNIDQANGYNPVDDASGKLTPLDWSQRRLPDASSQTSGPGEPGEAWEYMVALANATNTDMWINIPAPATDDYVKQLANLIKNGDTVDGVTYAGLKPNLKVYLEFSNEVWGGSPLPYTYNMESAKEQVAAGNSPLNNDGSTDQWIWAQRNYLEQTMRITNDFRSVMGADPDYDKIRPVLGWAEGYYQYYSSTFPWFEKTFGAPSQYFYGMGNAIYDAATDYSSVTNLISSLTQGLAQQAIEMKQFSAVANSYGLKTVAYEGGPDAGSAPDQAGGQVALAASRDPRMEALVVQEYNTWYAGGGDLAMFYDGPWDNYTPNNQYSALEVVQATNPTASPKYRGLVDVSQEASQAVTVGTVVAATGATSLSVNQDVYGLAVPNFPNSQPNDWLLNVPTAGNYTLSVQTGNSTGIERITVALNDTNQVGTFSMGAQATYNLATLSLHAGLNSLSINNLGSFTPLALTLTAASTASGSPPAIMDSGFEEDQQVAGTLGYAFDPTGSPWAFVGTAGVTANSSALTSNSATAPQGTQVGFLRNKGAISQTLSNWQAGTYRISFSAAQGSSAAPQTFAVLVDGQSVGQFTPTGSSYHLLSTPSFTVANGAHTITFQGLSPTSGATALLDNVAVTANGPTTNSVNAGATFLDSSFEQIQVPGTGYFGFIADPTSSSWSFSGSAGVSSNGSGYTGGNPNTPDGTQVGFIQEQGAIRQTITNPVAGDYSLSFAIAQRGNGGVSQTVQVWLDGTAIGTFTPGSTAYQTVATSTFYMTAGTHLITFQGMNNGGDGTAFIDQVTLTPDPTPPTSQTLGFTSAATLATAGSYLYNPQDTAWTFTSSAGISANNTAFTNGNPASPDGQAVAFLQNQGVASQTVANWAAGTYTISFGLAQRANYGSSQVVQVLVDGTLVGTFAPTSSSYQTETTASFSVAAGSHTVTFRGTRPSGDGTAFVDGVTIAQNPTPTVGDALGFTSAATTFSAGGYVYNPQDTAWTFTSSAGISANNTAFTNGNPASPDGQAVAFLQNQGVASQTVANWAAGTYTINFGLAQRANYGSAQVVQVLVDGALVGTFAPTSSSYQTETTASFSVAAGSHTVTFRGTRPSGDGTAFVSGVAITQNLTPTVGNALGFTSAATTFSAGGYVYNPQDTAWTFTSSAGISANNTAFTNGNPASPDGQAVAFLENQGAASQTVANWAAGTYTINFGLAQRANYGSSQVVQVLVDGVLVGTFAPTSSSYQTETTASFSVAAGSHTVTFQGTKSSGDSTAFVSGISIALQQSTDRSVSGS